MFKSAGSFLTFQAQLNSSWVVFLLKITTEVIRLETFFLKPLKKRNLLVLYPKVTEPEKFNFFYVRIRIPITDNKIERQVGPDFLVKHLKCRHRKKYSVSSNIQSLPSMAMKCG